MTPIPNRLKNIDVHFISLVDRAANRKQLIWKAENPTESPTFTHTTHFRKLDDEQQMAYGIVYAPDETDSQGHSASAAEIHRAMHHFMKQRRTTRVDRQHTYEPGPYFIAESWLVKSVDPFFKEEGAWAAGIRIEDGETWEQIKKEEITGFSIAGVAQLEPLEKHESAAASHHVPLNEEDRSVWERLKKRFTNPLPVQEPQPLNIDAAVLQKAFETTLTPLSQRIIRMENQQQQTLKTLQEQQQILSKRLEALEESHNGRQSLDGQDAQQGESEGRIFMPGWKEP